MATITPHPLVFEPIPFHKVWGGRRLERFGKRLPPAQDIGETWELADMPATSASGAGGGEARSVIASGPLKGRTLQHAMALWGRDLIGAARTAAGGAFPLLVKFLDARENLSVQVHPSAAFAAAHPEAHLKTECWYVLDAEPGAVIYKGVRPGVDRRAFEAHIRDGSASRDLVATPAVPGECHTLPSGTVHALGAGVLVAEVQTPSDTTFRVFDWGRTDRTLHVAEALECIDFGPAPGAKCLGPGERARRLAETPFFTIDERRLDPGEHAVMDAGPLVVMCVRGGAEIRAAGPAGTTPLPLGATSLIPAACAGATVSAQRAPATLLIIGLA